VETHARSSASACCAACRAMRDRQWASRRSTPAKCRSRARAPATRRRPPRWRGRRDRRASGRRCRGRCRARCDAVESLVVVSKSLVVRTVTRCRPSANLNGSDYLSLTRSRTSTIRRHPFGLPKTCGLVPAALLDTLHTMRRGRSRERATCASDSGGLCLPRRRGTTTFRDLPLPAVRLAGHGRAADGHVDTIAKDGSQSRPR
jgi:hypothetical protein